jgi:hypothetical protein
MDMLKVTLIAGCRNLCHQVPAGISINKSFCILLIAIHNIGQISREWRLLMELVSII